MDSSVCAVYLVCAVVHVLLCGSMNKHLCLNILHSYSIQLF